MPTGTPASATPRRRVRVVGVLGQRGVVASEAIATGEIVLGVDGVTTARPSRYSIQVGESEHVDLPAGLESGRVVADYPWQFLNHSCDPNVRLGGRALVAIRPIAAGTEVTFDYNTTEYDMASPFDCRCGASTCRGPRIAGYRHLSPADQLALLPCLSDAMRALVARKSGPARTVSRE